MSIDDLAINGGPKLRETPWPARGLITDVEKNAVNRLLDNAIATGGTPGYGGQEEQAYCEEFIQILGDKGFADAVNSGTNAVYLALRAVGVEPFSEVIVGAVTDPGGIMPIPLLGAIPVVADVTPDSYNTGPEQIEPLITEHTSAILVAHIAGEPADMEGIMSLARKHDLKVVEDAAQAHGARLNGRPIGTFGDASAFSTMFGKHHCTGGQGGVVYTRDEEIYKRIRWSSDRGKPFGLQGSTNVWAALNMNSSEIACAMGRAQLAKLPEIVRKRREAACHIAGAIDGLRSVSLPTLIPGAEASYWFLRFNFHADAVSCDKTTFIEAVNAEGGPGLNPNYASNTPHRYRWASEHNAFGTSGFPWASTDYKGEYKGDPAEHFPCPNTLSVGEQCFTLHFHESWTAEEAASLGEIFAKVEQAYAV